MQIVLKSNGTRKHVYSLVFDVDPSTVHRILTDHLKDKRMK